MPNKIKLSKLDLIHFIAIRNAIERVYIEFDPTRTRMEAIARLSENDEVLEYEVHYSPDWNSITIFKL